MEQTRLPGAHRFLLLAGLCFLGAAGAAQPASLDLLLVRGHDIRHCLESAQQLNLPVITRLPSGIIVEGGEADVLAFKHLNLSASSLPVGSGSYLYQVRSEEDINLRTLEAWGRVLVKDGNCAIIARDVKLTSDQHSIDWNVRLVALDRSPKPYRTPPPVRLRMTQYDPVIAGLVSQVDSARITDWVSLLQGYRTRYLASHNRFELADTIRNRFLAMGISDVVLDTFATAYLDSSGNDLQMNVVATIPGTDDTGIVYITGGHYDSYTNTPYLLAPGADDNGTGLAAVIEMARILAANPPRRTVRCIAFAAEEVGDLGSYHYAAQADSLDMNIGFMLCNDVMGNSLNSGEIEVYRYPGIEAYGDLLGQCASAYTAVTPRYIEGYYSSDDWPFWQHGYPAGRGKEYPYSSRWHTTSDSLPYVSTNYCAELTKAGLAMTAIMANYPETVAGLAARDIGDGHRLYTYWQAAAAANITGYRLYWGRSSGAYFDSIDVSSASDTITGLLADSLYYIAVAAVDDQGRLGVFFTEVTGTPRALPLAPSPVTATPVAGGVRVDWKPNAELDLAGYILHRRTDGGPSDSLTAPGDTTYVDQPLSGASKYYYTVRAYDTDGNASPSSAEAYGRPYTFDQGILLVDETRNWTTGNYPRDTTQDNFYHAVLGGYTLTDYEFDSVARKPVLADFAPYSTVVWHTDDRDYFLAANDTAALAEYLGHGGNLLLSGWQPLADVRNGASYPMTFSAGSFVRDYLKISYAGSSALSDTFIGAVGQNGYPGIEVDSAKVPLTGWKGTMRYIEGLTPVAPAEVIYTIDMRNNGSPFEGQTCGIRYLGADYKLVYLGYPLYFMRQDQARALMVQVMADFIGVEGKPSDISRPMSLRLEQNRPNPFARSTVIEYKMPVSGKVNLDIYNIAGQKVKTLVEGRRPAGTHVSRWDGRTDQGMRAAAGIYVYRLATGQRTISRRMIYVR